MTYEAAIKALELDPSLNEARSFASTANPETWGWLIEIDTLETLVNAEPANVNAMIALTYGLTMTGYFNEVIDLTDRIIELEPLAPSVTVEKAKRCRPPAGVRKRKRHG